MLEVGFGHKSPALAVQEVFEQQYRDAVQNDVVDFAHASGALTIDDQIKKSWDFALAFPLSARIGYLLVELAGKNMGYLDSFFKDFVEKGIAYIKDYNPDCVFATHPVCLYIAVQAKKILGMQYKTVAYVVDPFDGYAWWANEGADALLVATDYSRRRLLEQGIDESKIHIKGFPLNKNFIKISRERELEIKRQYKLNPDYPVVLIVSGAQGIGKIFMYADFLSRTSKKINILVVSGKNKANKARMDKAAARSQFPFVSLGYVTNMHELLGIADVIAGKAGASTAMESIFLQKPMIFTEWAAYNDRYIIDFVLDYSIGFYCPTYFSLLQVIDRITEAGKLAQYKKNIEALNMAPGAAEVTEFLVKLL